MNFKEKTFLSALCFLSTDPDRAKTFLLDKRLSLAEKTILKGYFHLRSNKIELLIQELHALSTPVTRLVESQKLLLLGFAFHQKSDFQKGELYITQALDLMAPYELPYLKMIANINLFTLNCNVRNERRMKELLGLIQGFDVKRGMDKYRVLQCEFKYYTFVGDDEKCLQCMEKISKLSHEMSEADRVNFLISKFDYYISKEDTDECYRILEEMKSFRKFNHSQNYNFIKILLGHYVSKDPIYIVDSEFKDHPSLYHQLKIIQALEESDRMRAQEHWKKLRELSPESYQENFKVKGRPTLFSLCLSRYEDSLPVPGLTVIEGESLYSKLREILVKANGPVRRELLFELVYNRPPESKEDLKILSRCVSRAKRKFRMDIEYRKGTYLLPKAS